jgi:hypothetical protein
MMDWGDCRLPGRRDAAAGPRSREGCSAYPAQYLCRCWSAHAEKKTVGLPMAKSRFRTSYHTLSTPNIDRVSATAESAAVQRCKVPPDMHESARTMRSTGCLGLWHSRDCSLESMPDLHPAQPSCLPRGIAEGHQSIPRSSALLHSPLSGTPIIAAGRQRPCRAVTPA